jgi:hypothetical protein
MLSPFHPLQIVLGLIVWALYFIVVYALTSIACEHFAPPPAAGAVNWLNGGLLALTVVVVIGLLSQAWRGWQAHSGTRKKSTTQPPDNHQVHAASTSHFINYIGIAVHIIAAVATLYTGAPALVLTPCI